MRDIFEEIFENQPLDPTESARRNMRPKLRARFYQAVTVGEEAQGFQVLLDGVILAGLRSRVVATLERSARGSD